MFKKAALLLHRWLGLLSGLIVFLVALGGTLYTFQPQIDAWREPTAAAGPWFPVDSLVATARTSLEADSAGLTMTFFREEGRPLQAEYFQADTKPHYSYMGGAKRWQSAFIDPATAQTLAIRDERTNWLELARGLHTSLLISTEYGPKIMPWAVVCFVVIGLTGLVVWWPKSRKALRQRLSLKLDAPPKKRTYDLHTVLGFYVLAFVLSFAFTGLMWSFDAWEDAAVATLNHIPASGPVVDTATTTAPSLDAAVSRVRRAHPDWATLQLAVETDPAQEIRLRATHAHGFWRRRYIYWYNPTTQTLRVDKREVKGLGDKVNAARYNLHTGQAMGLPGQVLVFCAGLIACSLPVTGLLMYLGNRRKPKKKSRKPVRATT